MTQTGWTCAYTKQVACPTSSGSSILDQISLIPPTWFCHMELCNSPSGDEYRYRLIWALWPSQAWQSRAKGCRAMSIRTNASGLYAASISAMCKSRLSGKSKCENCRVDTICQVRRLLWSKERQAESILERFPRPLKRACKHGPCGSK